MTDLHGEYGNPDTQVPIEENYSKEVIYTNPRKERDKAIWSALSGVSSENPVDIYQRASSEIDSVNSSPTSAAIEKQAKDEYIDQTIPMYIARAEEVSNKEEFLRTIPADVEYNSSIKAVALETLSTTYDDKATTLRGSREFSDWYMTKLHPKRRQREALAAAVLSVGATMESGVGAYFADAFELALPGQQISLSRVGKKYLGEHYTVLGGEMMLDLAEHIRSAPEEEQVGLAKSIAKDIRDTAGVVAGNKNQALAAYALQDLENYMTTYNPEVEMKWTRYLENAMGIADLTLLAPLKMLIKPLQSSWRSATKMSNRGKADVLSEVTDANPDVGSEMTYQAILDDSSAEAMGVSSSEAYSRMLPTMPIKGPDGDELLQGAPLSVIDRLTGKVNRAQETIDDFVNTKLFTDNEFLGKELEFKAVVEDINSEVVIDPASSSIERIRGTNDIDLNVNYGANRDTPLLGLEDALEHQRLLVEALESNGVRSPKSVIMVRDEDTGSFRAFNPKTDDPTSPMMVSYKGRYTVQPGDTLAEEIQTKSVGRIGKYFLPPSSTVRRQSIGAFRVSNDKKFVVNRDVSDISSKYTKMGDLDRNKVTSLLRQGELDETSYTYAQVAADHGDKIAEGYVSARMGFDFVYRHLNTQMKKRMDTEGYRAIRIDLDGDIYENAGVPTLRVEDAVDLDPKVVYNPYTRETTAEAIVPMYENGYNLVKLQTKLDAGEKGLYSHAWIKQEDIYATPANVLPYRQGYIPRINNDPYFITRKTNRVIDGVTEEYSEVVMVAKTAADVKKAKARLLDENPTWQLDHHMDKNIDGGRSALESDRSLTASNGAGMWYKKRGDRLHRYDSSESAVEDPIFAMEKASSALSNTFVKDDLVNSQLERHRLTYQHLEVNGKKLYEFNSKDGVWNYSGRGMDEVLHPEIKAANLEMDYIETMAGMPVQSEILWKQSMKQIDKMLAGNSLVSSAVAPVIKGASSSTPASVARGVTFYLRLAMDPPRQFLLNAANGMHLLGMAPVITLKASTDASLLRISQGIWDQPKLWDNFLKNYVPTHGYTGKEWNDFFQAYRNTGKPYSADSNVVVAESNFGFSRSHEEGVLGIAKRKAINVAKSPAVLGKVLGFNQGEEFNLALSYSFSKRLWEKNNPGKAWNANNESLQEIADKARSYATDMTNTDAFPYQKGMFAAFTQFTSFSHKALLNTLPTKLGGHPDYEGMRARYLLGMTVAYGSAGLGISELYGKMKTHYGIDVPPVLDNAIQGGAIDVAWNVTGDLIFDQDIGTNRARAADSMSMAASQFTFPIALVENLLDQNFLQAVTGPSGGVVPSVADATRRVKEMWGMDNIETDTKFIKSVEMAYQNFGIFSKFFQYNLAVGYEEMLGEYHNVNKTGGFGGPSTHFELLSKKWFGFSNQTNDEMWDTWRSMNSKFSGKAGERVIKEDAKKMAWWLNQAWIESGGDHVKFYERTGSVVRSLHSGNQTYGWEVQKLTKMFLREQPNYEEMMLSIANKAGLYDSEATEQRVINAVKASNLVSDDQKGRIIDMTKVMYQDIKNANKIYEEVE